MVPCVVSAVKSGAMSLMRGMLGVVSIGVTLAVLMVALIVKFGSSRKAGMGLVPPRLANAGECQLKKRNPPDWRRVGVRKRVRATHTPAPAYNNTGHTVWSRRAYI